MKKLILIIAIVFSGMLMQAGDALWRSNCRVAYRNSAFPETNPVYT